MMKVFVVYRDDIFNDYVEIFKIYMFCYFYDVDLFIIRIFVKDNIFVLKLMYLLYSICLDI